MDRARANRAVLAVLAVLAAASFVARASAAAAPPAEPPGDLPRVSPVRLGVDVLLAGGAELLAGKRVGLLTNASGVDGTLVATADRMAADRRFRLVQLFSPEHGIRGAVRAGTRVEDGVDPATGIPCESLFGERRAPSPEALARVEVLVFDVQDVGSRTYTFTTTMALAMAAAAKARKPFVVLDRPNPLGGLRFEGPVREDRFRSFIGWGPVPVTHGMTVGELARFYNEELAIGCELHVVPMAGWRREQVWEDTGLLWVPTSPGIPHARHAPLYVATGMIGGVTRNVNEGVGTTMPFELVGAGFIDAGRLAAALEAARLPGVRFRPLSYGPYYGRFRAKTLHGVQLHLTDARAFRPLHTALTILVTLERLYPGRVRYRKRRAFGRVWGTTSVLDALRRGQDVATIEARWAEALADFARRRQPHLLYP